jgi:dolichol-phosphate mannosyltransferase
LTSVTVVLPTYNERGNILALMEEVLRECGPWHATVLVVDDDSPDGTWEAVQEVSRLDPRVRLLRRIGERGLTSAIDAGISATDSAVVVWMDCDFSMPPHAIPLLVSAVVRDGFDVAIGSRYVAGGRDRGHSLMARAFSRSINLFAGSLLGFGIKDYTSGFVAARRPVLDQIKLKGDYGEYCIHLLACAQRRGFRLCEVPFTCETRRTGESKTGTSVTHYLVRGWKYVLTVLRLALYRQECSAA